MKKLKSLSERHHAAIRLRVEGRPNREICAELSISPKTLHQWWSDDLVRKEISHKIERIDEVFTEKLAMAGTTALDTLTDILMKPSRDADVSDHLKMEVANNVLDRIESLVKIRDRVQVLGAGSTTINNNSYETTVAAMSDERLLEYVDQFAKHAGDVEGTAVESK